MFGKRRADWEFRANHPISTEGNQGIGSDDVVEKSWDSPKGDERVKKLKKNI